MGFLRNHRQQQVVHRLVAAVIVAGGVVISASAVAFGAATLSVSQTAALAQGQVVTISGSGLAPNSFGYVLECNGAPGEPTLTVGPPFNESIPIGCSAPSLKHIVSTAADGSLSTTFKVHESRKLGPPCSQFTVFGGCPPADSAHKRPRADAQNYPCPPSPAQQAAGVTCSLTFYDTAHERVSTQISFQGGGGPPIHAPTTTVPKTTTTTTARTTTTTTARTTTTTTTRAIAATTTLPPITRQVNNTSPPPATAHVVVKASSGTLAFTGLGTTGKIVALLGVVLVLMGLVLFFVDVRKLALWLLGF